MNFACVVKSAESEGEIHANISRTKCVYIKSAEESKMNDLTLLHLIESAHGLDPYS